MKYCNHFILLDGAPKGGIDLVALAPILFCLILIVIAVVYSQSLRSDNKQGNNPIQSSQRRKSYYFMALNKYADFSGRSRRSEYWWFVLCSYFVGIFLGYLFEIIFFCYLLYINSKDGSLGFTNYWNDFNGVRNTIHQFGGNLRMPSGENINLHYYYNYSIVQIIYWIAVIIPALAVMVRRMHDVGKSGWNALIPVYGLVLAFTDGDKFENKYGPDPKNRDGNNPQNNLPPSTIFNTNQGNNPIHAPQAEVKVCPECGKSASIKDSFCMECGFAFPKKSDAYKISMEDLKGMSNSSKPIATVVKDEPKTIEKQPSKIDSVIPTQIEKELANEPKTKQGQPVSTASVAPSPTNETNYKGLIIAGLILLVGIVAYLFYTTYQNYKRGEQETTTALQNKKRDSIATVELMKTRIGNEALLKMKDYYQATTRLDFDANRYFAQNVIQYIKEKNLSPNRINEIFNQYKGEFANPEISIKDQSFAMVPNNNGNSNLSYYQYWIHFKCFRTSKGKVEECDILIEIGMDAQNAIVSYKENKIENLTFKEKTIDEPANSSSEEFKSSNYKNSNLDEFLIINYNSDHCFNEIFYRTSIKESIKLKLFDVSCNSAKAMFPTGSDIYVLSTQGLQLFCQDKNGANQVFEPSGNTVSNNTATSSVNNQLVNQDSASLYQMGYVVGNNPCGQNIHTETKWVETKGINQIAVYTFQHRLYDKSSIYDQNNNLIWEWKGESQLGITWYPKKHFVNIGGNNRIRLEFHQGVNDPFCNGLMQIVKMQ